MLIPPPFSESECRAEVRHDCSGTNPRSHHKGATGRLRTGDQQLPVLCDVSSQEKGIRVSPGRLGRHMDWQIHCDIQINLTQRDEGNPMLRFHFPTQLRRSRRHAAVRRDIGVSSNAYTHNSILRAVCAALCGAFAVWSEPSVPNASVPSNRH